MKRARKQARKNAEEEAREQARERAWARAIQPSKPRLPTWPADHIPVEIFNSIIQFLPRKDVQSMRCVNHEFDSKLSETYFNIVVVPFRPEFEATYGLLNVNPRHDKFVISGGHRVFQEFGHKMRKFALALEVNERDLGSPPVKVNQEIIRAPWGLYRWPIMSYQRYSQLEGLEHLADETGYMKKAFQHLGNVTDIGISCDVGLGWLHGPDINPYMSPDGPSVFRPTTYGDGAPETRVSSTFINDWEPSPSLKMLRQMALNAGYSVEEWPLVILRLLEDEGCEGIIEWEDVEQPDGQIARTRLSRLAAGETTDTRVIIQHIEQAINLEDMARAGSTPETQPGQKLLPLDLTIAQAEMLLELEWAHRALMQSYRIAVMDNKDSFQNLRQLTIARCSGCHIATWCNSSFWETMTCIETLHLGVIADWREVHKQSSGHVVERRKSPLFTCGSVFKLLQDYVGEQPNIRHVSFEWICGGEYAMGKSQRDRYILPAPVVSRVEHMTSSQHVMEPHEVLHLPYVQRLSLKNCWFSPHVFLCFFKHMGMEALVHVNLNSVSLSGPVSTGPEVRIYPHTSAGEPKPTHWPWPLCAGAEPGTWFLLENPLDNTPNPAWTWLPGAAGHVPAPGVGVGGGGGVGGVVPMQLAAPPQAAAAPPPQAGGAQAAAHATGIAVNSGIPPILNEVVVYPLRWRGWSWPHILARLGLAPTAIQLLNRTVGGQEYLQVLDNLEKNLTANWSRIFRGREDKQSLQSMTFRSCGYVLIDIPSINNWQIIPDYPIHVKHTESLVGKLREYDLKMLTSDEDLLAKIMPHITEKEKYQMRAVFGFGFGWQRYFEDTVIQAAMADGNPNPGQGRFFGRATKVPTSLDADEEVQLELMQLTSRGP
ncbi:hypothetical protein M406DRAFT_245012 [Cryphonectria parasitica EP155]|uniref:F-box domain-containing protein n=1 Tax=Cryphonectria parasitica (strain ATCC 38755 / EP155) TaxID=660469 RepID=A0A9P4YCV0_CRYP1|nr:uncharacterized protein M406DRAFT_245012 [Cryphonectria parasitica EP155]KAF3770654.1 hypothetical protein M406DRAFT_245012 [Cryphonectria parasitica EP155]